MTTNSKGEQEHATAVSQRIVVKPALSIFLNNKNNMAVILILYIFTAMDH